jgi:hypothetical protein
MYYVLAVALVALAILMVWNIGAALKERRQRKAMRAAFRAEWYGREQRNVQTVAEALDWRKPEENE